MADDRPRILYITHRVPYPPDKGDRIRNYHVLREMAERARVWLVALADEPVVEEHRRALAALCERVETVQVANKGRWLQAGWSLLCGKSLSEGLFREQALIALLPELTAEANFHSVMISASSLASCLDAPGLAKLPKHVDLVDVDSQKWLDFAAASRSPKNWLYRLEGGRVRALETRLTASVQTLCLVSKAETELFNGFTHPDAAITASNGVDLDYFHPQPDVAELPACVFVGAMDYFPNVDAAVWYATTIHPQVREQFPEAEFHIVGRKPTAHVQKLAAIPGVRVLGTVPDVRPHVAAARLAVCPIRVARGLQNKVIEAMAMAKPTLSTPAAMAALQATPGHDLLQLHSADDWVRAICELWLDGPRRTALGQAARQYVQSHHHWHRCVRPLIDRVVG